MNKNKKIGEMGEFQGWIIRTNTGVIFFDDKGEWWLGGWTLWSSAVYNIRRFGVPLFGHRIDAQKMAKKIKRQRPDLISWTKTTPVFLVETGRV